MFSTTRIVAPILLLVMTAASACMTLYSYPSETTGAQRVDPIESCVSPAPTSTGAAILCGTCGEWLVGSYRSGDLCSGSAVKSQDLAECESSPELYDCNTEQDSCLSDDGNN
jgi:hypothetical protein